MKKSYKIMSILILIMIIVVPKVAAFDITGNPWETAKDFLEIGATYTDMHDESIKVMEALGINTKRGFEELLGFIWGIGLLVIFVSTVILGIKYMMAQPDEKSKIKQATTPYIVGVIIIFGAITIWRFVIVVLESSM